MKQLSPNEVLWLVQSVGITGTHTATGLPLDQLMAATLLYESNNGDPQALGRSMSGVNLGNRDLGLGQSSNRWNGDKLQKHALAGEDWRDPYSSIRVVREIFDDFLRRPEKDGMLAWKGYTGGGYKTYLPDVAIAAMFPFPPPRPQVVSIKVTVNGAEVPVNL